MSASLNARLSAKTAVAVRALLLETKNNPERFLKLRESTSIPVAFGADARHFKPENVIITIIIIIFKPCCYGGVPKG